MPDDRNANKGTERGNGMVERSLQQYGAGRSILIDRDNRIIAGNKTFENAGQLGMDGVIVVESDGRHLVAVKRTDLSLDDPRGRELALADNRAAEVGLEWDPNVLKDMVGELDLSPFFTEKELAKLGVELGSGPEAPEPKLDKAEELREKWQTARGQVWEIPSKTVAGKSHRVMCGDCAVDSVALMAGALADLVWTDPPYNVDYGNHGNAKWGQNRPITNDALSAEAWVAFQSAWMTSVLASLAGAIYICMSAKEWPRTRTAFEAAGGHWSSDVIWVKDRLVLGRKDFHSRYEAMLYGWVEGKEHCWLGERTETDIWEIERNSVNEDHPTQKPVALVVKALSLSCPKAGVVHDPFCGSGTTMVAAESVGRLCYGMEIEPKYVAVALERMADMGLEPRLV